MLSIAATLIAIILIVIMAKKRGGKRRAMGRYIRGTVDEDLPGGTLAGKTLVSAGFDEAVQERTLVSSIVAIWSMNDYTPIASVGPVLVGVAHGDYSDAEIEEWIETTGSWDEGDLVQQEVAKRKIRRIGVFSEPAAATQAAVLNDGKAIKTKLNWILNQGITLKLWIYNQGTAAFATTDPRIRAQGHVNLWPR